MKRILVLQGHPDPHPVHFGHALAGAYVEGARMAGHAADVVTVATSSFGLLRTRAEWEGTPAPPDVRAAQDLLLAANHLALFFPLWMGTMPAILHAFLEQLLRPGFAVDQRGEGDLVGGPRLRGRSARLVVTMGMPAPVYRWYFLGHGVRGLERSMLGLCGITPARETFVGGVEQLDAGGRERWLTRMRELGRRAR